MIKLFFLSLLSVLFFSCDHSQQKTLRIATSANMKFAMDEIIQTVNEKQNLHCEMIVGSSGKLTAQITEGAPYDVFVSANVKYPETLYRSNKTINEPKVYAKGSLVAWTLKKEVDLNDFLSESVRKVAIANPKTAPYGKVALDFLIEKYKTGSINDKLVFGESIAQVNQFVSTKTVDVGITAKSVVMSTKLKSIGRWVSLDTSLYNPVEQGVVLLQHAKKNQEQANQFYNYLFSPEGKEILIKYGYIVD